MLFFSCFFERNGSVVPGLSEGVVFFSGGRGGGELGLESFVFFSKVRCTQVCLHKPCLGHSRLGCYVRTTVW